MAGRKKASSTTKKKEEATLKQVENMEQNLQEVEEREKLEKKIKEKQDAIKEDLKNQLISQGKFGQQFDDMIEDYIYLVGMKCKLQYDIDKNGLRYKTTGGNGFTSYKPNESVQNILKVNNQMLKILQDLELKSPDPEKDGDDENDLL